MKKRNHKADIILIICLLAAGAIIALVLLLSQHSGKEVQVRINGQIVRSFSLDEDAEYEIEGADGGKNRLLIQDQAAWIEDADCPDKLCEKMGKITLTGQSIVCLPHKVVVEILDGASAEYEQTDDAVDVIAE